MRRYLAWIGLGVTLGACGSDSDDRGAGGTGAAGGTGGSVTGGAGGAAGTATGGSAGAATGGSAGTVTGGSPGTGGSGGAPPGCAAPTGPNETAICLTLDPEIMTFQDDPRLDGSGVLRVEMFAIDDPPEEAEAIALYHAIFPSDAETGGEISLNALPSPRIALPDVPSTVYFRVAFVDNPEVFTLGGFVPGTWVGGVDFSGGVAEDMKLSPVSVTPGAANEVTVGLSAVRGLLVTVDASATPVGDGEGPLAIMVTNSPDPAAQPSMFGIGINPCANVADMPFVQIVPMIGPPGTYYVTGALNDLGGPWEPPGPGMLVAMDVDLQAGMASIPHVLTLAQGDYTPTVSIDLSFAVPWPGDAGPIPPNACTDIFPPGDGGAP
jgi:hypothetical protein